MPDKRPTHSEKSNFSIAELGSLRATYAEAMQEYEQITDSRTPEFSKVRTATIRSREIGAVPAGTVLGFFGSEENETLAELAKAAAKEDLKTVDRLVSQIEKDALESMDPAKEAKPEGMAAIPVFGELRYRTKTISRGVFLDSASGIEVRVFPYNGGQLHDSDFQLVQYKRQASDKLLGGVLLICPPELTDLERVILDSVPREQTEANIGVEQAILGAVFRAVTKALGKVAGKIVEATKRIGKWAIDQTGGCPKIPWTITHVTHIVTVFPGDCPLLPGATSDFGRTLARKGASAAELLNARKDMLHAELMSPQ